MRPSGFTDLHQHVLWGIDDGPNSPEEMRLMLDQAEAEGIRLIAATSHAYPHKREFDIQLYMQRLSEANQYCAERGLRLKLIAGCEIAYSGIVADLLLEGRLPTLGNSRYVLIEFPWACSFKDICVASERIYRAECTPIIAHVERCRCMLASPRKAIQIRSDMDLIYQLNCETVVRPEGLWERHFVETMLRAKAIDLVATDAHDREKRTPAMKNAYEVLQKYGYGYADALVSFGWRLIGGKSDWGDYRS